MFFKIEMIEVRRERREPSYQQAPGWGVLCALKRQSLILSPEDEVTISQTIGASRTAHLRSLVLTWQLGGDQKKH